MNNSTSADFSSKDEGDPPPSRDRLDLGFAVEDNDEVDEATGPSKPSPSSSPSSSPCSPSASPQPAVAANGRISVSLPLQMEKKRSPLSPLPLTTQEPAPLLVLALAVPSQSTFPGGPNFSGGAGREDCWTESATEVLLDAWAKRYVGLSKGNLKQNNWKEVADIVNGAEDRSKIPRTDIQCKNRIDTVKKKYKTEKARVVASGGLSQWKFFDKMNRLLGHMDNNPGALAARTKCRKGSDKVWTVAKGPRSKSKSKKRGWASGWESDEDDNDDDEEAKEENAMEGLLPPISPSLHRKILERKGTDGHGHRGMSGGGTLLELMKAIESFGEVYEQTEQAKLRDVVEMEKQRMKFTKEMEVERMQFFMKTQVEIWKHGSKKAKRTDGSGNSNTTEDRSGGGKAD